MDGIGAYFACIKSPPKDPNEFSEGMDSNVDIGVEAPLFIVNFPKFGYSIEGIEF